MSETEYPFFNQLCFLDGRPERYRIWTNFELEEGSAEVIVQTHNGLKLLFIVKSFESWEKIKF